MIASKTNQYSFAKTENSFVSLLMQDIFDKIMRLAKFDSNVIIIGEIGSGKKQIAEIIHEHSNRSKKPFHSFYCVDINEEEYKNAFWGQLTFENSQLILKYNALEKANGGILFLDQFSELSHKAMLNIIESIEKGCLQLFRVNHNGKPRLILSFNQETYQELLHTQVWKTLLNKLDPVVIVLPPLRERKEDIPVLINHFITEMKNENQEYEDLKISERALYSCTNYSWPGNIRQLKNAMLQGAILSLGQTIEPEHLPFMMNWNLPYKINLEK